MTCSNDRCFSAKPWANFVYIVEVTGKMQYKAHGLRHDKKD
jgi:hypothetical protein